MHPETGRTRRNDDRIDTGTVSSDGLSVDASASSASR